MIEVDWLSLLRELAVVLLWAVPTFAALLAAAVLAVVVSRGIRQGSQRSPAGSRGKRHRFSLGARRTHHR